MDSENFLYMQDDAFTLYKGKMQDVLSTFDKNSVDSIICDPPYELNFMGKGWDNSGVAFQPDTWKHCYDVLKDGGYLLAFGGSRTFHRIAVAIEDAGFEIRDTIMWLYGSGFPKSMDISKQIYKKGGNDYSKQWSGWGTALKPAYEPIIVARKPFKGSLVDNVLQNGVGGLNIDECRVGEEIIKGGSMPKMNSGETGICNYKTVGADRIKREDSIGRFPANVILTYDESDFDEVCGEMPNSNKPNGSITKKYKCNNNIYSDMPPRNEFDSYEDSGSASRYFYCAKASKKDRDEGLDEFEEKTSTDGCIRSNSETARMYGANSITKRNIHPTVKPVELMQYLVRLVSPKGATILDCFMGSGSTGKAVMFENRERNANYHFIGIEMTEEYLPICYSRINYALNQFEYEETKEKVELKQAGIQSIFDFI